MHGLISMFAVCTTLLRAYKELLVATRILTYRSLELKLHAVNSPSKRICFGASVVRFLLATTESLHFGWSVEVTNVIINWCQM